MTRPSLLDLENHADFIKRHIGPTVKQQAEMAQAVGYESLDALIDDTVPAAIRLQAPMALPGAQTEQAVITRLKAIAAKNVVNRSFIGTGYHDTYTPAVIQRNVLENPGWYTAYTPYQPEISQGRLEALLTYQQMVMDLTGMELANASMLDEGTAAAEAMTLLQRVNKKNPPSRYRFRGVRKNGETIYLEVDAREMEEEGKIAGTRAYLWDITKRVKVEESIKKHKAMLDGMKTVETALQTPKKPKKGRKKKGKK